MHLTLCREQADEAMSLGFVVGCAVRARDLDFKHVRSGWTA